MTLRGFPFVNYYSKILLQLCQLYSTGRFIAELTLYQMLESGKDTRFTDQTTVAMSHNKQLIDIVGKECTEVVNED